MSAQVKVYPRTCWSDVCGRVECEGCQHADKLAEFKLWQRETQATRPDETWCPSVWVATREVRRGE